jgi:hypothetical protein
VYVIVARWTGRQVDYLLLLDGLELLRVPEKSNDIVPIYYKVPNALRIGTDVNGNKNGNRTIAVFVFEWDCPAFLEERV